MTKSDLEISFDTALDHIQEREVGCFEADLREVFYGGGTSVRIDGDVHECAPPAWETLCSFLDVPADLLPQLREGPGGIIMRAIHGAGRRSRTAPENLRLAHDSQGRILAMTDADLAVLSNMEVITSIRQAWPDISSETLSVSQLDLTDTEFELSCHTEQRAIEPRPGDVLHGGITIRHSQVGQWPTVVLAYIHRLVCSNGLTQRLCLHGRAGRVKRAKADNSPEPMLEAIRLQVSHAWEQVQGRLDGMHQLLEHRYEAEGLSEGLRRRWSIKRDLADQIAQALGNDELERTYTEYDLVNALSRVVTHNNSLAPRYRRQLSLAAGTLAQRHIRQCPTCGTWLSENINLVAEAALAG